MFLVHSDRWGDSVFWLHSKPLIVGSEPSRSQKLFHKKPLQ